MSERPTGTRAADAILAAVLPAAAARLWVDERVDTSVCSDVDAPGDADVAVIGTDAGGEGAPCVVRVIDAPEDALDTGTKGRIAVRARDHAQMRLAAATASTRLWRRGYRTRRRVFWDRGQVAHVGGSGAPPSLRPAERLPRRAVVVASRDRDTHPTILDVAADEALGTPAPWPLVRSGTLVALSEGVVLRVAVGAGRERLDRADRALRLLQPRLSRPELVPAMHGGGAVGLGTWTAEERLRGAPSPSQLPPALADDLLELLVDLRGLGEGTACTPVDLARAVGRVLGPGRRTDGVLAAGEAATAAVAGLGTAFTHGDLWHGNLLTRGDRLAGVIDWDSARSDRLPFTDALHVVVAGRVPRGSRRWGAEVALELRSATPAPLVQRYADAIGVTVDADRHRSLVLAYWLDRLAFQVTTYADRTARPRWLAQNVDVVLEAIGAPGS